MPHPLSHIESDEDRIVGRILAVLPVKDNWCVEFGAWDGKLSSNTRNLITKKAYSAVLIEADHKRYEDLLVTYSSNKNVISLNAFVDLEGANILDNILKKTPLPHDFDFISIDIDGNDYHVWESFTTYDPKIVCIEHNPTIPTEIDFVQKKDVAVSQGSSLKALTVLGKKKGYELAAVTHCNAIFIRADLYPLLKIADNRPETLRTDTSAVTYIFSGYDGRIILRGKKKFPWHGIVMKESRMQILPWFLRKYPENYNFLQHVVFNIYLGYFFPRIFYYRHIRKSAGRSVTARSSQKSSQNYGEKS